jgi:hypothetical protein
LPIRDAYIIESSDDQRRHVCIDALNEAEIMAFLGEDNARIKRFRLAREIILRNLRNTEIYDKENIDKSCKDVTAIKMFKGGQNIRLYCKEIHNLNGNFYVIVAELLKKKKDNKVKGKTKTLIQTVASYEYRITERPQA